MLANATTLGPSGVRARFASGRERRRLDPTVSGYWVKREIRGPELDESPVAREVVGTGSAARIVALLEAVARSDAKNGVRSLARESGIDKSAVSRLLRQLTDLGMLEASEVAGRYHIGPRFFAIARAVASKDDMSRAARPILERLVATWNETCYMAVLERGDVSFREKVECDQPIRYVIDQTRPSPIHAGSAGRAILSALPDEEFERLISRGPLQAVTPHTITDSDELRRRRREDRKRGYTISMLERSIGGCGIAAPFFGWDGRCLGSLVITMPQTRFDPARFESWGAAAMDAAATLSQRLGRTTSSAG
jgi:DNA-binding IclR family transcriptional regulator